MNEQETFYTLALTRMTGFNFQTAQHLYQTLGGGQAVYEHRNDIVEVLPDCSPRLAASLKDWNQALQRAAAEMEYVGKHKIRVLCQNDADYPARLRECADAPIVLFSLGTALLNQRRVVSIVGTRHSTQYGHDLIHRFIADLRRLCPQVLIVSGLAYGVDICAHREALAQGYETVAVLAHGLDEIYPTMHRQTAIDMLKQGGLLTEYMTQTNADKRNFVQRNRIVAGMADATILVESAAKGGGLITMGIAQSYDRSTFAFPGPIGAPYSEGCNHLIRDNGAALITSAEDFVKAMGWQTDAQLQQAQADGIERSLFPDLSPDEQRIVSLLGKTNDLQQNVISVKSGIPIGQLTALLFQLEMKGILKPLAGGTYHLIQ